MNSEARSTLDCSRVGFSFEGENESRREGAGGSQRWGPGKAPGGMAGTTGPSPNWHFADCRNGPPWALTLIAARRNPAASGAPRLCIIRQRHPNQSCGGHKVLPRMDEPAFVPGGGLRLGADEVFDRPFVSFLQCRLSNLSCVASCEQSLSPAVFPSQLGNFTDGPANVLASVWLYHRGSCRSGHA